MKEESLTGTAELVHDSRGYRLEVAGVLSMALSDKAAAQIRARWERDAASKRTKRPGTKRTASDDTAN